MRKRIFCLIAMLALFVVPMSAQFPVATPQEAVAALLDRIGGSGASEKIVTVIDASLADNGNDVFIITSDGGKPCIKGNNQLSVSTGINWYLNHYARINLTWNNLTTDLVNANLPVPESEEIHVCNTKYRYDFNTCTFSYSMAFWTWERWQQEIDWMALHGINAPLNLVGLDVVTRKFLKELNVSEQDINSYIAGPGFIAWFAMNNLEGWGGTINAGDVTMNGNPDWWYARQEKLCQDMLQRMRELGMQPVIPGFSGQVPNCIVNYSINGFNSNDVVNNGTWAGGYTRPDILKPNTESYRTFAAVYYKHLHEVMGVSEFYSIDPFHEGSLPSGVTNETCYPNIMAELDNYFDKVDADVKSKYNVDEQPKWIIQYWQGVPQSGAFSAMSGYGDRFIGLDLFSDAPGKAKWNTNYFQGRPYIFCMLHNFGGRSGMHGRLESTMNDYFAAIAKGNNCQGIGATPEGTETNPILYDMLFELPWMDPAKRPTADEWLKEYAHSRYGVENATALSALQDLKKSVWACPTDQQGTSEAVILARPSWEVKSVSSWSTSAIYWKTQDVLVAAEKLISIGDLVTSNDGVKNYNYDLIDVVRQSMVDYAAELLPLIKTAREQGNTAEYNRLYKLYLQLMLDLDKMLSYDENFKLERWTSLARNIADEAEGTTVNDRNWLEWNARTQVTVWSKGNTDLHDYSNRCWAGLIKDFHYRRWKHFFENNGNAPSGGWFSAIEYPWTVDFTNYNYSEVNIPSDMTATQKAVETFGNYFGVVNGVGKNYVFPMGVTRDATKSGVVPELYRGQTVELPLKIGKNVAVTGFSIDLNNDGAMSGSERLTVTDGKVAIPADAEIGKTTATATFEDGTSITFALALIEDITTPRTVTAVAGSNGTVKIEGSNALSVTTTEAVRIYATPNTGYNFNNWTDAEGNVVSNDNPYIYYGKEGATFTANFIQDKWGVVACSGALSGDIAGYGQYIHNLTFAYYNREKETIFAASSAPTEIFNTIPQIVNVPQGASFDVEYDNGGSNGLKFCYFRAYIDLNADGDFDDEGELLKTVGTEGAENTAVCSNKINVVLPYNIPLGITHMRLRFDGAWDNGSKPSAKGAKDASIRPVYEIVLNVTEFSDKASHITVKSNNEEWGTVAVWTDETPDGSTRNEWDVTKGVPFYIKAVKTSNDVEFLGWYDQYGRLVTTELECRMYAREDATYTAKFRKFLEISGWQLEYRTQQGESFVTTLANNVAPEEGKTYYICSHAKSGESYNNRYLYDNSGTLATAAAAGGDNYLWTCIRNNDGTYSFKNGSGNYLANNSSYHISVGDSPASYTFDAPVHEGISLVNAASYDGGKYMVTNSDGTAYNRNSTKVNNDSWSSDYIFFEVGVYTDIVLTAVRESGENDLVLPRTVEVLGEQCTIVGLDNNLFSNNKELWSITMPSTIEFLSQKSLLSGTMTGKVASGTGTTNADYYTLYNLQETIKVADGFKVTVRGTSDGSTYNQWGSGLFATGTDPLAATFDNGFQFYLAKAGNFVLKVDNGDKEYALDNAECKVVAGTPFTATIEYRNNVITITVDNGAGQTGVYTRSGVTLADISAFSAAIPTGVTLTVNVETNKEANPFQGCSNLDRIAFDGTCQAYYVNSEGDLYNAAGVLVCSPEGKSKGADRRELATLIKQMEQLTAQVATYTPLGTKTEVALQNTQQGGANYLWTNAQSGQEGPLANLIDNSVDTHFHTDYSGGAVTSGSHYIAVDLGTNAIGHYTIDYTTRKGASNDYPDGITVYGSYDNDNYTQVVNFDGNLPQSSGVKWEAGSNWLTDYRYFRFNVYAERGYWHMSEFNLYKLTTAADVFSYLEGAITNAQAAAVYDALLAAKYIFDNATTAEQLQAAKAELQSAYDTLDALLKSAVPVTLTTDEENPVLYKIFIKRTADVTVLHYDEASTMVAVANSAANSSAQAWYFTASVNGVCIHPYNADGKVLSADNTSNSPAKVWAVVKGEKSFYEWKFVSRADGYYNIQARDGSNYFSNNGGTTQKMGFWSGSPDSDTGSLFKFVEAQFENDNARYYQLSDYFATVAVDGTNIYGGTSVGLYTGGKEYREAYVAAKNLNEAGNTSDADACYNAYNALRSASAGLQYNAAESGKLYVIKSASTKAYCSGKYVRAVDKKVQHSCGTSWKGTYNHTNLLFDAYSDIDKKALAMFAFEPTANTGEYKMKNLHTGLYVKAFAGTHLGTAEEAATVKVEAYDDNQVILKIGNNAPMHAQQDGGVIVQWAAAAGGASLWTIDEVETSVADYDVNISSAGWSTLNLGYAVSIPEYVSVYAVSEVSAKYAMLTEVTGLIPANTAVLINAAAGEYTFCYDESTATYSGSNLLLGSNYDIFVEAQSDKEYYMLGNLNGNIGLYVVEREYNASGATGDTHIKNNANKAYLSIDNLNPAMLSFIFDGTTGIDEVGNDGVAPAGIYDLSGRRLDGISAPGLYIVDGKKMLVK